MDPIQPRRYNREQKAVLAGFLLRNLGQALRAADKAAEGERLTGEVKYVEERKYYTNAASYLRYCLHHVGYVPDDWQEYIR